MTHFPPTAPLPQPQPQATSNLSVSVEFPILDISYQ